MDVVGNKPQPAAAILRLRRISNRQLAEETDFSPAWIGRVLNGYAEPSKKFRRAVARVVDLPESKLFRESE